MKKLLKTPFLLLLLLSMLVALPFIWKEMGILPAYPQEDIEPEAPVLSDTPNASLPEMPEEPDNIPVSEEPEEPNVPASSLLPEASDVPDPLPKEPDLPPEEPEEPDEPDEPAEPEIPEEPEVPVKPEDPFSNALFIGDSRTVGIAEYSGISDADFYAYTGASVYTIFKKESTVGAWEKGTLLENVLTERQYDRIYLMLGVNELGYNFNTTMEKYGELIARLRELQPDAYLILQASLHVASARSDSDNTFNNGNIDRLNQAQAAYADNEHIFFIDVNPVFDDENGALAKEYTGDNTHPYGKYYAKWADWLRENTPA